MSFFLPYDLTPQGWLTDMLLAQIYDPGDSHMLKLKEIIYKQGDKSDKIFNLHPDLNHQLIEGIQKNLKPWKGTNSLLKYVPVYGSHARWLEHKRYVEFLTTITPAQSAAFIPYMRIFTKSKEISSSGTKKNSSPWTTRDIVFKTFTDIAPILNENFTRGASAGIKSMSMRRHLQAFGASQSFYIDLEFFFSSMKTFINGHQIDYGRGQTDRDYVKLIKNLGGETTECREGVEVRIPEEHLNIEYGWKISDSVPHDLIPMDIRETVQRKEKKSFALRWISHSFKFSETGEINLSVNYMGTPDELMYKNSTDVDEEQNDITALNNKMGIKGLEDPELARKHEELKEKRKELRTILKCEGSAGKGSTKKEKCVKKGKKKEAKK